MKFDDLIASKFSGRTTLLENQFYFARLLYWWHARFWVDEESTMYILF